MPACQADRDPAVDVSLNPEPPDPVTGTDRIPECYDHTLSATGSGSGNPVVFTADPSGAPGACAVSGTNGSAVTYTGPGTCVIDANEAANQQLAQDLGYIWESDPAGLRLFEFSSGRVHGYQLVTTDSRESPPYGPWTLPTSPARQCRPVVALLTRRAVVWRQQAGSQSDNQQSHDLDDS